MLSSVCVCSEELPELNKWSCATQLDKALRNLRKINMQQIVEAALALKHGPETELSAVLEQAEDWSLRLRHLAEEVNDRDNTNVVKNSFMSQSG